MTRMVDADDLVGVQEIAALLECNRAYAYRAVDRPDFPAPVAKTGAKVRLWLGAEVVAWHVALPEPQEPRQCGTLAGYVGGCRCSECRAANTDYQREWRKRQRGAA